MSYQVVELLQLIFALVVMFAAFLGGVAVGWWRWGKPESKRREAAAGAKAADAAAPAGLFTAHERTDGSNGMPTFDTQANGDPDGRAPTFAASARAIGTGDQVS